MKILLLLLLTLSFNLHAKTCKAALKARLKYQEINFPFTKVYYPDNIAVSREAKWEGNVITKKFIAPEPIEIECGKPFFVAKFDNFKGTAMLPPIIETYPWTVIDWSGNPRTVDAEKIYGLGDSAEYPYPATFLNGTEPMMIDAPAPAGVKDICDVNKFSIPDFNQFVQINPDPLTSSYNSPSVWGTYRWDPSGSPANEVIEVTLENAEVIISCDTHWKYEATFEWPYVIPSDDESLCGPGEVHRKMELEGDFFLNKEDQVFGFLRVKKPEVTYSGTVRGEYNGSGFTLPMEGRYVKNASGKDVVLMPIFQGGDGISWSYTLQCPYGPIQNTLFGAVSHYFMIMNNQEVISTEEGGFFELNGEGDEKTFNVDMGGQGTVTIKRSWKKLSN